MADVPEHLLRRSAERRKALGLPGGEEGEAPAAETPADPVEGEAVAPAAEVPAAAASEPMADAETASGTKIPAHLLERAKRRKAAVAGGDAGVVAGAAAATATATIAPPAAG